LNQATAAGNTRCIVPADNSGNYIETTLSYKMPAGINGSTFIDLYPNGGGYFGKTGIEKTVVGKLGLKTEVVHINDLISQVGFGANMIIPTPKWAFAKAGILPIWHDGSKIIENKSTLEYFVEFSLPKGFVLSNFGELNLTANGGPKWIYGEISLSKKIGKFDVSYNPVLLPNGDTTPSLVHRISVGIEIK
jgi:hypothetical protein